MTPPGLWPAGVFFLEAAARLVRVILRRSPQEVPVRSEYSLVEVTPDQSWAEQADVLIGGLGNSGG